MQKTWYPENLKSCISWLMKLIVQIRVPILQFMSMKSVICWVILIKIFLLSSYHSKKDQAQLKNPLHNICHCNNGGACKAPTVLQWGQTKEECLERSSHWSDIPLQRDATSASQAPATYLKVNLGQCLSTWLLYYLPNTGLRVDAVKAVQRSFIRE